MINIGDFAFYITFYCNKLPTILGNWGVLQSVGIDGIVEFSENWGVAVFKGGIKLFYLLLLPHKFSVKNSVDLFRIEVFIGGTALIWLESDIPYKSSVNFSDEFLSLSKMLKYIW